jgi:excisionase family DNA binding protein
MNLTQPPDRLLTRDEVATRLNCSIPSVKRYNKTGELKLQKVGPRLVRIYESDMLAFIQQRSGSERTKLNFQPDIFKATYGSVILEQVANIIRARCGQREAEARIRQWAKATVSHADQTRCVSVAIQTLLEINDDNFARLGVRRSQYVAWQVAWETKNL